MKEATSFRVRKSSFYNKESEKLLINSSIKKLEKKFNEKIVTYIRKFDVFYYAESYHQDYYKENFVNYLMYKKACGRVKTLEKIWN